MAEKRVDNMSKHAITSEITGLELDIADIDAQIDNLRSIRSTLVLEKEEALKRLQDLQQHKYETFSKPGGGIDYSSEFPWSRELKIRMEEVFGIKQFRLCQEGVCNANMDERDIVCVMPTGGGKSLTYQLPALLHPGCTLVISPLISLMKDQILHMSEAGVEAVMLIGSTSQSETNRIYARLTQRIASDKEIKLCYVTPEKISKNKRLLSTLQEMAQSDRFARIVIDEAHCVSQMGHDFRQDYRNLSKLRQLFPNVPILALSATCPPAVLKDLLSVLQMKPVVEAANAPAEGTVYFTAPLYRKNLHYRIMPKPDSKAAVFQTMVDYILTKHPSDSGIVYCFKRADTEEVAKELSERSGNKILTGVYHADVTDRDKEKVHEAWREGRLKVVCATIAFGMGIDKSNVRFVLHHSLPKSIDGFYQESGRAGRDGGDADCLLYYRPQDAMAISTHAVSAEQEEKVRQMVQFVHDGRECRKLQFAKYFSASTKLSMSSWTSDQRDALASCGHCDNCTRSPESVVNRDVTLDAWQVLKLAEDIKSRRGTVTMSGLNDLARGARGGEFNATTGKRRGRGSSSSANKQEVDLEALNGGPWQLSKTDGERLIIHLLLDRYLKLTYIQTAYATNVYLEPGPQCARLTRFQKSDVEQGRGPRISCDFFKKEKSCRRVGGEGPRKKKRDGPAQAGSSDIRTLLPASSKAQRANANRINHPMFLSDDEGFIDDKDSIEDVDRDDEAGGDITVISDQDNDDEWAYSLRSPPSKRLRVRSNDDHVDAEESEVIEID